MNSMATWRAEVCSGISAVLAVLYHLQGNASAILATSIYLAERGVFSMCVSVSVSCVSMCVMSVVSMCVKAACLSPHNSHLSCNVLVPSGWVSGVVPKLQDLNFQLVATSGWQLRLHCGYLLSVLIV